MARNTTNPTTKETDSNNSEKIARLSIVRNLLQKTAEERNADGWKPAQMPAAGMIFPRS